jgi:hypothetical protein
MLTLLPASFPVTWTGSAVLFAWERVRGAAAKGKTQELEQAGCLVLFCFSCNGASRLLGRHSAT